MKIKRKGEIVEIELKDIQEGDEEVTPEATPESTPETTPEAAPELTPKPTAQEKADLDAATVEKVSKSIEDKITQAFKDLQENPVKKSPVYHKEEVTLEKSVMETEPYLRSKRPFVKLSPKMDNFIEGVRAMARNDMVGMMKYMGAKTKALGESNDETGGYLVPEEFQAEIVRYVDEATIVRPRARVFNMTRDSLTLPTLVQSSSVFGGVVMRAVAESGEGTDDIPVFGRITLEAKKIMGLVPMSNELLDDSAVNLANFLVILLGEATADYEDAKFLAGTGINQPLGIVETSGITLVSRQTSSRIVYEDIIDMLQNTLSTFDKNAVWITNKAGVAQLLKIDSEATSGVLMFIQNLRDDIPATVLGKPVLVTERVKSLGTKGDILYGDLSHYFIGDRGGIKVDSSMHERFRFDETLLRMIKRFDGQLSIAKAFTALRE